MRSQTELERLTREVLGDDYLELAVTRYTLTEDVEAQRASIHCQLVEAKKGPLRAVEGAGCGLVDALFDGLKRALVHEYPSLDHIHFVEFSSSGDFKAPHAKDENTDVPGIVRLAIENHAGRHFHFEATSASISASSVACVVQGVEHFVNAELAVLRVYEWIEDARRRSRPDLADKYTQRLADLVQNASYSESIERRRSAVEA